MKKYSIKWGLILFVIGVILFLPLNVRAETVEELNTILDSIIAEDEVNLKAISPANISDTTYRNSYIEGLEYYYYDDDTHPILITFSDDYSNFYIKHCDENNCTQSKTKKINWTASNQDKINEIITFVNNNKSKRLMDIEYLDYFYKSNSDYSFIEYLESKNTNNHISFKTKRIGMGNGYVDEYIDYNLYSPYPIYFYYDDIVYFATGGQHVDDHSVMELTDYPVLFIPSKTSENIDSYISASLKKVKSYYPNENIDVKNYQLEDEEINYANSRLQFGYNNGLIDRNLNSTFEPLIVKVTIGSMSREMIIAKANDNKLTEYVPDDLKYLNNNYISSITNNNTNNSNDETIKNPQTGVCINYPLLILGIGIGLFFINIYKKKNLFRKL